MSAANNLVGMVGRVTSRVRAGSLGEVLLALHGGTSAYFARPADPQQVIERNAVVLVIDYDPSLRTVYVATDETITANAQSLAPPPV